MSESRISPLSEQARATHLCALACACITLACSPTVFDKQAVSDTASGTGAAPAREAGAGHAGASSAGGQPATPDELPSGALLWLAADQADADASGAVLEWKSLGSGERAAHAADSDSAPKLVTIDQQKWLAFDGRAELILPKLPAIAALSFFAVVNADHAADDLHCPSILHLANRAASSVVQTARLEFGRHMAELLYQVESKEITATKGSGLFPSDAAHLVSVIHTPDRIVRLELDAKPIKQPLTVDLPEAVERDFNYIGHNHYYSNNMPYCQAFQGRIAEILLFDRAVSEEERVQIEHYLAAKWSLTLAP